MLVETNKQNEYANVGWLLVCECVGSSPFSKHFRLPAYSATPDLD